MLADRLWCMTMGYGYGAWQSGMAMAYGYGCMTIGHGYGVWLWCMTIGAWQSGIYRNGKIV